MSRALLTAVLTFVAVSPPTADQTYDLAWTTHARLARGEESAPPPGTQVHGRAVARLVRVSDTVRRLDFTGPQGSGGGLIGPQGPMDFQFPAPSEFDFPPAVPHLTGGSFVTSGDPERPDAFVVSYVEGFICRTTPLRCGGVSMWERRFEGRGIRR